MSEVLGYVVVRLPEFAAGFAYPATPPLELKIYRGVDRLPWEDLREVQGKPSGRAPGLRSFYAEMQNNTGHILGIPYTENFEDARKLLSDSGAIQNEIIAVSHADSARKVESILPSGWKFIGYDGFSIGEWSLIREGIFLHRKYFEVFEDNINVFGLFYSRHKLYEYCNIYIDLQEREVVEPIRLDVEIQHLAVFISEPCGLHI
jgi:hypothetical protein